MQLSATQASPSYVFKVKKSDGTILDADQAATKKFSRKDISLVGQNIRSLLSPVEGERTQQTSLPRMKIKRRWCLIDNEGQHVYANVSKTASSWSLRNKNITIQISPVKSPLKDMSLMDVLIADDAPMVNLILPVSLQSIGFNQANIVSVENGRDALTQVAQKVFDIIILDNSMPVKSGKRIDGLEAAKKIRQLERKLSREPSTIFLHSSDEDIVLPGDFDDSIQPKQPLNNTLREYFMRHRLKPYQP